MGIVALFIGIILIVSAVRNSQGALFSALETDVPKFVVWGAAILAVGAIGAIPGLKPASRWLLALIIIVLIVNNYQKLVAGFQNAVKVAGSQTAAPATTASGASGNSAATGAASVAGTGGSSWENAVASSLGNLAQ